MSSLDPEREVPLPEYEISQYFPRDPDLTPAERTELREEYGYVRAYFKTRPNRHRDLQRWLNQSRAGTTYDRYLTRTVYYAAIAAVVGLLAGAIIAVGLDRAGVLAGLTAPVDVGGGLVEFVAANKVWIAGGLLTVFTAAVFGGATWSFRYYYPRQRVDRRRQRINFVLPHAIVFMYALSHSGMDLLQVLKKLARSKDAYGAVAEEFDMVVRDVELFGNDLYTALRNARNLTPSDNLEQFLDDMVSVLESGGNVTRFFEDQSERYMNRARDEQEDFLETLSLLSEVFIVGFVAAPLFLIVILMVIAILGGASLGVLGALIYGIIPLGMAAFLVVVSVISDPYVHPEATLEETPGRNGDLDASDLRESVAYQEYQQAKRWTRIREFLAAPVAMIRQTPAYSLVVTAPIAVIALAVFFAAGSLPTSADALLATPIGGTFRLVVVPFLVMAVPLAFFHEIKRGRELVVTERFPDTLNILASANQMGIDLVDALAMVSQYTAGRFADELRLLRNDIRWNNDMPAALIAFGNRVGVPDLVRTVKLIAEGSRSTGDLSRVLSVAAEDARNRYRLARNRSRAMSSYVAVVVIGYLVYLMVIVLVDTSYLQPIAALSVESPTTPGAPIGFTDVPVDTYRLLFFHSVLVQGVGSGLLAGKLTDNSLLTGLKYSVLLVALSVIAFTVI